MATVLQTELATGHPVTGAYDNNAVAAAVEINAKNVSRNKTEMTGSEILQAVDAMEWASRSAIQQRVVWDVVHLGMVNPFGVEADLISSVFSGAGGATLSALNSARTELISQATSLGLGIVKTGHIERARA